MGTSIYSKIRSVASGSGLLLLVGPGYGADGTGNVYLQNPVVDPVVHSVALTNLEGGGFLIGDAADVINPVIARAYSAALDFSYAPDFPVEDRIHFGEVMAYYHITEYYKYAIGLGVAVPGAPVGVDVFNAKPSGYGWVPITSAYDSTTGRISLETMGDFEDSDAVDGDVILHEYAHALQHTLRGDANLDDCVDGLDYVIWSNNYDPFAGEKIWQQGDHNGDGIVDGLDYVVWSNHYLEGCPPGMVPEPATLSLLAIGSAALVLYGKRRSRSAPGKELVPRGP